MEKNEKEEDVKEVILQFINRQATKWKILINELDLTYAEVVMMFAILAGELLYKRDDDDFNKKLQAYIRKSIKKSFEAQKEYYDGLQK